MENQVQTVSDECGKPLIVSRKHIDASTLNAYQPIVSLSKLTKISSRGAKSPAVSVEENCVISTKGFSSKIALVGDNNQGYSEGEYSHVLNAGNFGSAKTCGDTSHAVSCGKKPIAEVRGKNCIAACLGSNGLASAGELGLIILAFFNYDTNTIDASVGKIGIDKDIDNNVLEPNATYRVNSHGQFILVGKARYEPRITNFEFVGEEEYQTKSEYQMEGSV